MHPLKPDFVIKMMKRIVEPELMDDQEQAAAYAAADFSEADLLMMQSFLEHFPDADLQGPVLDLGCGPGNMTFRFAEQFPQCQVIGVDGSTEMLGIANQRKQSKPELSESITFIHGIIPQLLIPTDSYSAIISNSFLHHLHRPQDLWEYINRYAKKGCKILIMDLFRPDTPQQAQHFVDQYAETEPEILRRDFYNSLLAALTADEIEQQLLSSGLAELMVQEVSDRHVIIVGKKL